jgi:hypothetical protein
MSEANNNYTYDAYGIDKMNNQVNGQVNGQVLPPTNQTQLDQYVDLTQNQTGEVLLSKVSRRFFF